MPSASSIDSAPVSERDARNAAPVTAHAPAEGGCLCGAIRYRIDAPPSSSVLCHCRSCRRASGAPVVAWITVPRAALVIRSGAPVRFESSPGVVRQFCGRCGSPLTYERRADPSIDITTASLDQPERFAPTGEVWLSQRLEWQPAQPTLEHSQGSSLET